MTEDAYAVILSFNRETKEQLFTEFEGDDYDDPGHDAEGFRRSIRSDFPESDGWIHVVWKNKAAADGMTQVMLGTRDKVKQAVDLLEGTGYKVV